MLQTEQILQGRYQLQQQLGNNAGRQTWLVKDISTSTGELAIVKLLAFSPELQWDEFKLFEREAQVLKQLNHPRIPNYLDYFSLDKQMGEGLCWFGLVQEYIPGKSLQQALESGQRFSEAQVKAIATQILEILIYLHEGESPVIHRDIKPSNIILGEDDQIYLVDFGAVQDTAAAAGATFTIVGTTGYAPLEQFWGKAIPASDLYALGATLVHLLTGICPADLPQDNLRIQFQDKVSINPNLSSWIESLIEPNVEHRVSMAKTALHSLNSQEAIAPPLMTIPLAVSDPFTLQTSSTEFVIILSSNPFLQMLIFAYKMILLFTVPVVILMSFLILIVFLIFWIHLIKIGILGLLIGMGFFSMVLGITLLILREWSYLCEDLHFPTFAKTQLKFSKCGEFLNLTMGQDNQVTGEKYKINPRLFSLDYEKPNLVFKSQSKPKISLRTNLTFDDYQVIYYQFHQWLEEI